MSAYFGKIRTLSLAITIISLGVLPYISTGCSDNRPNIQAFCQPLEEIASDSINWHYAIYLDINACLTCCEDMKSWQMLEQKIPECSGMLSIWAPIEDSIDVAEVMRLEGIKASVNILDTNLVKSLRLKEWTPPVKLLINKDCELIFLEGPLKAEEAREFDLKVLEKICGE